MSTIQRSASTSLPTRYGTFTLSIYHEEQRHEHLALTVGSPSGATPVLVRLHSECITGDLFGSARCDCGEQLDHSLRLLQAERCGVLIYLRQEGRGIGLVNKIRAYALQEQGLDTVEANRALGLPDDMRDYGVAAEILADLGIGRVRLLTNNPDKIDGLTRYGIEVCERVPLFVAPNATNLHYLKTKQQRMGHLLPEELNPALPGAQRRASLAS
ncbi:GTP cyclohydrolase II [Kouleothrix sp.]|uniref:GTP cyclohydrolase II n=1 Tax=Kouleothrix sp. TaxID=2779161 RepID=UPI00391A152F